MSLDRVVPPRAAKDSRSVPSQETKARVRAELSGPFAWPSSLLDATRPLHDLSAVVDLTRLSLTAAAANNQGNVVFTLVSKEYIQTGLHWIDAMRRLGLSNFMVIAGDEFTAAKLSGHDVHCVLARIDETGFDPSFVTHDGFSAKGLSMIALKFPITKFLLEQGYNVIFSDSDAIWLGDPMAYVSGFDIAFQRVAHHPPALSSLWSFAVCSGFLWFRGTPDVIRFVEQCIAEQRSLRCDQVAMNVALLEQDPQWVCEQDGWSPLGGDRQYDKEQRLAEFARYMRFPIEGAITRSNARLLALPHDKFWRHMWVERSMAGMVICHPNSPKNDAGKIRIFEELGIYFGPHVALKA
jgi:hypothetical protein